MLHNCIRQSLSLLRLPKRNFNVSSSITESTSDLIGLLHRHRRRSSSYCLPLFAKAILVLDIRNLLLIINQIARIRDDPIRQRIKLTLLIPHTLLKPSPRDIDARRIKYTLRSSQIMLVSHQIYCQLYRLPCLGSSSDSGIEKGSTFSVKIMSRARCIWSSRAGAWEAQGCVGSVGCADSAGDRREALAFDGSGWWQRIGVLGGMSAALECLNQWWSLRKF